MHEVLVNRLGGLSLPRKSVVRLTDRPDMTLDVYRGRKTTIQQYNNFSVILLVVYTLYAGRAAMTNVVRTCGPTHLLIFDLMSNKICLNQTSIKPISRRHVL